MSKYGPGPGELKFRLAVGILGLLGLVGVVAWRGMPSGPAFFEIILIGGAFFGGTAVLSYRALRRLDREDGGP